MVWERLLPGQGGWGLPEGLHSEPVPGRRRSALSSSQRSGRHAAQGSNQATRRLDVKVST